MITDSVPIQSSGPVKRLHVACCADDAFTIPLAVMVQSVIHNLDPQSRLELFVLDNGISEINKNILAAHWNTFGAAVRFLRPDTEQLEMLGKLPTSDLVNYISKTAYLRLYMDAFIPAGVEKLVFLDCDLIVRTNLGDLWGNDLENKIVLAVQDYYIHDFSRSAIEGFGELGIDGVTPYFNAGVLGIDMRKWRDLNVSGHIMDFLQGYMDRIKFMDQDVLNVVLANQWKSVDYRWNQQRYVLDTTASRLPFDAEEMQRVLESPYIVHYTTYLKPWIPACRHPFKREFFQYLDMTPWKAAHGRAGIRPATRPR